MACTWPRVCRRRRTARSGWRDRWRANGWRAAPTGQCPGWWPGRDCWPRTIAGSPGGRARISRRWRWPAAAVASGRLWLLSRAGALLALPLAESAAPPAGAGTRRGSAPLAPAVGLVDVPAPAGADRQPHRPGSRGASSGCWPSPSSRCSPRTAPPPAAGPVAAPWSAPALPPGPDARCLPAIRARAVERALAEPERARSLVTRAGRSAWLPELRLADGAPVRTQRVARRRSPRSAATRLGSIPPMTYDTRCAPPGTCPGWCSARKRSPPYHQALRIADMRREIESLVNRLYFERRRLSRAAGRRADPRRGHGERLLRLEELEAELDAVSGGRVLALSGRRRSRPPVHEPAGGRTAPAPPLRRRRRRHRPPCPTAASCKARTRDLSRNGICLIATQAVHAGGSWSASSWCCRSATTPSPSRWSLTGRRGLVHQLGGQPSRWGPCSRTSPISRTASWRCSCSTWTGRCRPGASDEDETARCGQHRRQGQPVPAAERAPVAGPAPGWRRPPGRRRARR